MSKRQGIMLASPFNERKFESFVGQTGFCFQQRKLNGERMKWENNRLVSSEGNLVTGVPHIWDVLQDNFRDKQFDGEAYLHGMSRQAIHGIVSRETTLHPDHEAIQFHIFDLPIADIPQVHRTVSLYRMRERLESHSCLKVVETFRCHTLDQAASATVQFVNEGYEGSILRHVNGLYVPMSRAIMMKWKPKKWDIYTIVAVLEGTGKYEGTLGSLVVSDAEGRTFHVGSFAIPDGERDALWLRKDGLPGAKVKVQYTELSDDGVPPSSVYITIVAEAAEGEED